MNKIITFLDIAEQWQIGFQDPATPVIEGIINFHHDLMFFLIITTIFVCWLLFRCISLFNEEKKEIPTTFVHGTKIEIIWSIIIGFFCLFCLFISIENCAHCGYIVGPDDEYNCSFYYKFDSDSAMVYEDVDTVRFEVQRDGQYQAILDTLPFSEVYIKPDLKEIYFDQISNLNNPRLTLINYNSISNFKKYDSIITNQCHFQYSILYNFSKEKSFVSNEINAISTYFKLLSQEAIMTKDNVRFTSYNLNESLEKLLSIKFKYQNFLIENQNGPSLDLKNENIKSFIDNYNLRCIPHKDLIFKLNGLNFMLTNQNYQNYEFFYRSEELYKQIISYDNK